MAQENLEAVASDFLGGRMRPNASGDVMEIAFRIFVHELQKRGVDLNEWGEEDWFLAMEKFGIHDDRAMAMFEDMSSWGIVDNRQWESPLEQAFDEAAAPELLEE